MRVILADEYGFCNGVKRALARLDQTMAAHPETTVFAIGDIIHNDDIVSRYRDRGVKTVKSIWEVGDGVGVVRAHGLPESVISQARTAGLRIIDATCPFVRTITRIIQSVLASGVPVYLVGEKNHPEVIAATADFGDQVRLIDYTNFDADNFDYGSDEAALLSQTTMAEDSFNQIVAAFVSHLAKVTVFNTICRSTRVRQASAVKVARRVAAMVVLGGRNSSNARRLAELCSAIIPTQFIDRIADLDVTALRRDIGDKQPVVGVTAGASTPDDIVAEAVAFLEMLEFPAC